MIQLSEEISVAYNSQPDGSPTEYIGAEISIGYLPSEEILQQIGMIQYLNFTPQK